MLPGPDDSIPSTVADGEAPLRNKLIALVLVLAFVVALGLTALASHLANSTLFANTTGAKFNGQWEWYTRDEGHGGWHYWGTLKDTGCGDGDNVYSKIKIEGYSPNSIYGDKACDDSGDDEEYQNYELWDPQATKTTRAEYWACRDRNFPLSDNCSDENNLFTR